MITCGNETFVFHEKIVKRIYEYEVNEFDVKNVELTENTFDDFVKKRGFKDTEILILKGAVAFIYADLLIILTKKLYYYLLKRYEKF